MPLQPELHRAQRRRRGGRRTRHRRNGAEAKTDTQTTHTPGYPGKTYSAESQSLLHVCRRVPCVGLRPQRCSTRPPRGDRSIRRGETELNGAGEKRVRESRGILTANGSSKAPSHFHCCLLPPSLLSPSLYFSLSLPPFSLSPYFSLFAIHSSSFPLLCLHATPTTKIHYPQAAQRAANVSTPKRRNFTLVGQEKRCPRLFPSRHFA